jgi:probable F420-dependent oxidoreductase
MQLKRLGVWAGLDGLSAQQAAAFAQRVEAWGYGALWIPEAVGREAFSACSWLLANTTTLIVATGIANIYARDAFSAAAAQKGLNEQSDGRFLMGLGVSHVPLVEGLRHLQYGKPVATMRSYLQAMAGCAYRSVLPAATPQTILAALGPKMLELSGQLTDGAHPYNVPPPGRRAKFSGPANCCASSRVRFSRLSRRRRAPRRGGFSRCIWACPTMWRIGNGWASATPMWPGRARID